MVLFVLRSQDKIRDLGKMELHDYMEITALLIVNLI
jgi:hypothetical protein